MPLLQGVPFKLVNKINFSSNSYGGQKVFVISHTGEQFLNEGEYEDRLALYSQNIWSCQCTGKSNMTHQEAWSSEAKVRAMLETAIPEAFRLPLLSMVQHSTSPLEFLVEAASAAFHSQYYPGEELEYMFKTLESKVKLVKACVMSTKLVDEPATDSAEHALNGTDSVSNGTTDASINGGGAAGGGGSEPGSSSSAAPRSPNKNKAVSKLRRDKVYEIKIFDEDDGGLLIKDVLGSSLVRKHKPPAKENIRLFIRANAIRTKSNAHCPWIVSEEVARRYNLSTKLPAELTILPQQQFVSISSTGGIKRKSTNFDDSNPIKIARLDNGLEIEVLPKKLSPDKKEPVAIAKLFSPSNLATKTAPAPIAEDEIEYLGVSAPNKQPEAILPDNTNFRSPSMPVVQQIQLPQQAFAANFLQQNATTISPAIQTLLSNSSLPQAILAAQLTQQASLLQALTNNRALFPPQNLNSPINSTPILIAAQNPSSLNLSLTPQSFLTNSTARSFNTTPSTPLSSRNSSFNGSSPSSKKGSASKCTMVAGKNIVMGPDGQLRKKRGRPVLSEEEKARKRQLQKQMASVFQNLGVGGSSSGTGDSQSGVSPLSNKASPHASPMCSPNKSPQKRVHTSETIMKMPLIRRLLFEQKNKKNGKGYARKFVYTMDHAVTRLSLAQINLVTDEQLKENLLQRHERMLEKKMVSGMTPEERESYLREKAREEASRRRHEKQEQNRKSEDQKLQNLLPLPPPSPVVVCDDVPTKSFSNIAMMTEFIECFQDVFAMNNVSKVKITTNRTLKALAQGRDGYEYLSSILCTLLPVVIYDSAINHYEELGVPLREIPISYQTAPELARLCLKHQKLNRAEVNEANSDDGEDLIIGEEEDELSEDLLVKLTTVDMWELSPAELVAFLTALTHRCMAADLLAHHVDKMEDMATKIYKERASLKKERLKEDTEIKQKKREERRAKKNNKKPPGRPKGYSPKLGMTIADFYQVKNSNRDSDLRKELFTGRQKRKTGQEKIEEEKKLEEQKEVERAKEQREQRFRECEELLRKRRETLRVTPLGLDRYHNRYWLFHTTTPGLYVEKCWLHEHADYYIEPTETPSDKTESKPNVNDLNGSTASPNKLKTHTPAKSKGRPKANSFLDIDFDNQTLPPLGENQWYVYKTEDEVNALLNALTDKGVREFYLKQNILSIRNKITENLKCIELKEGEIKKEEVKEENEDVGEAEQQEAEEEKDDAPNEEDSEMVDCCLQVLESLREDITQIERELIEGHLGGVENFDKWEEEVMATDDVGKLGKLLVEAQRAMLLKNLKGFMMPLRKSSAALQSAAAAAAEDNDASGGVNGDSADAVTEKKPEEEQQPQSVPEYVVIESPGTIKWREAVQSCQTLSRLHVLVGMFDSCIRWEKSLATKKCTVCRNRDKNKDILVLCDKCDKSYHWTCLRPKPTAAEPPPTWYCSSCTAILIKQAKARHSREYQDVEETAGSDYSSRARKAAQKLPCAAGITVDASEPECKVCEGRLGLIFCSKCSAAYHSECHRPPLLSRARKDWKCCDCEPHQMDKSSKKETQQVTTTRETQASIDARRQAESERRRKLAVSKPRSSKGQFLSKAALASIHTRKKTKQQQNVSNNRTKGRRAANSRSSNGPQIVEENDEQSDENEAQCEEENGEDETLAQSEEENEGENEMQSEEENEMQSEEENEMQSEEENEAQSEEENEMQSEEENEEDEAQSEEDNEEVESGEDEPNEVQANSDVEGGYEGESGEEEHESQGEEEESDAGEYEEEEE